MISELLLPKLSEWQPTGTGRHSWSHYLPDQGWNVFLTADRVDSLGSLVWELSAARLSLLETKPEELKAWADRVAKKATGLMEPLRVIEIDSTRQEALLRSESPASRADRVFYYEVKLFGKNRAELRRFEAKPGVTGRRDQVPFALTNEAIAKLLSDLLAE
jgi:hypothetical protein